MIEVSSLSSLSRIFLFEFQIILCEDYLLINHLVRVKIEKMSSREHADGQT
ncbi:unnamed protein product, partial [Nesidiocoris tenuis]